VLQRSKRTKSEIYLTSDHFEDFKKKLWLYKLVRHLLTKAESELRAEAAKNKTKLGLIKFSQTSKHLNVKAP
jgi:hypothetical protein